MTPVSGWQRALRSTKIETVVDGPVVNWVHELTEDSPIIVRAAVRAVPVWHSLYPGAQLEPAATPLECGTGVSLNWSDVGAGLAAFAPEAGLGIVEDRLLTPADDDVHSSTDYLARRLSLPATVNLGQSVFEVVDTDEPADSLRMLTAWQFPVLLVLHESTTAEQLVDAVRNGDIGGVLAVAASCRDGETIALGLVRRSGVG